MKKLVLLSVFALCLIFMGGNVFAADTLRVKYDYDKMARKVKKSSSVDPSNGKASPVSLDTSNGSIKIISRFGLSGGNRDSYVQVVVFASAKYVCTLTFSDSRVIREYKENIPPSVIDEYLTQAIALLQ